MRKKTGPGAKGDRCQSTCAAVKADREICCPTWDTLLLQAQGSENEGDALLC